MTTPRIVTLEFLRHGPPHNQLLSPLTQYLALCGNHSAATVRMPFEHQQLLIRLNSLIYKDSLETRMMQLADTSQIMGEVLSGVPGLIAELADSRDDTAPLTHLRLILSASELALLPFELANAPDGFPGAGQPIALQAQVPVCITREVRRVSNAKFKWPRQPKILFIAAAPPGVGPIPLEEHLLALRTVIDPWVTVSLEDEPVSDNEALGSKMREALKPHLRILPEATVSSIQKICAEEDFTHVHILAHGIHLPGEERKYGLALHSDGDPSRKDVVDGPRLAKLLRTYRSGGGTELSGPAVVTLASCHGGAQGSVVGAGASIAHALHEGGIPLVVASQFPISFAASVIMAEVLYEGLLWGTDPRVLLNDLRWQLKAKLPETHDWASLVAYASLPADIGPQLLDVRIEQAHESIDVALRFMDKVTDAMVALANRPRNGTGDGSRVNSEAENQMKHAREKKDRAVDRLKRLLNEPSLHSRHRNLIYGLLASTEKRDAKILFHWQRLGTGSGQGEWVGKAVTECLKRARKYYEGAFKADRTQSWALVQEMALRVILKGPSAIDPGAWSTARYLSEADLFVSDRKFVAWAHSAMIELYLLAYLRPDIYSSNESESKALEHVSQLAKVAEGTFELYSARRQIERYKEWFFQYEEIGRLLPLVDKILDAMPDIDTC